MTNQIRQGTNLYRLASFILKKGMLYKQDALLYAVKVCNYSEKNGSALLHELVNRGVAVIDDFTIGYRSMQKTTPVVHLTEIGFNMMVKHFPEIPRPAFEKIQGRFNTKIYEMKLAYLNQNHIKTLFNCAGVQTEPLAKPSLFQLVDYISRNDSGSGMTDDGSTSDPNYMKCSESAIANAYERGIYYGKDEYLEFYHKHDGGEEALRSVFRGIFVSSHDCLVIYSNGKNNPNMIRLPVERTEKLLVASLINQHLATVGHVADRRTGISALAISDAGSFIYSTASSRKYGRKDDDFNENLPKLLTPMSSMMDQDGNNTYTAYYCIAYGKSGSKQLHYLTTHYYRKHMEKLPSLAEKAPQLLTYDGSGNVPLRCTVHGKSIPAVYMPVYELLLLNKIRHMEYSPVIITSPDMVNTIAHITHKHHLFIASDTMAFIKDSDIPVYDKQGYVHGKHDLEKYLSVKGLMMTAQAYHDLPKKYNMNDNEFYNAIAAHTINLDDLFPTLDTVPAPDKKPYKRKKKTIAVDVDIFNAVKKYAEEHNVAMSTAVARCIQLHIPDDES